VVEVSDMTIERDRLKLAVYATAGVREVWIVGLPARTIHVHRAPETGQDREVFGVSPGQTLTPEAFPDIRFAVNEILS
jgi:Uma2 family endonuclease